MNIPAANQSSTQPDSGSPSGSAADGSEAGFHLVPMAEHLGQSALQWGQFLGQTPPANALVAVASSLSGASKYARALAGIFNNRATLVLDHVEGDRDIRRRFRQYLETTGQIQNVKCQHAHAFLLEITTIPNYRQQMLAQRASVASLNGNFDGTVAEMAEMYQTISSNRLSDVSRTFLSR
ncbi:MAG TPA: hypothetical protein VG710_14040 [Opitutus sp.]|nr:hypothetical protein [Opitutus sp.]